VFLAATENGHYNIVKTILQTVSIDSNAKPVLLSVSKSAKIAVKYGYIDIINLLLDEGVKEYHKIIMYASGYGHIEIVKLMLEKSNNCNKCLIAACNDGHLNIVKLLLSKGSNKYIKAIKASTESKHNDIVDLLKFYSLNN
jgi:ankyrin repeat protein